VAKFELITRIHDKEIHRICDEINDQYFADDKANESDWADTAQTYAWFDKNDSIFTVALLNGEPVGFYEMLPLTKEATDRFINHGVTEDQITADDIVEGYQGCPAYGAYISGFAVKNGMGPHARAQCNAALFAGFLQDVLYRYDEKSLKYLITNPVSDMGLALTKHFGSNALLVNSNPLEDTFFVEITPSWREQWLSMQRIYRMKFVSSYKEHGKL
jgi:hypothetical protein